MNFRFRYLKYLNAKNIMYFGIIYVILTHK